MKHLVFYDGQCGLCDRIVNFILWADKEKKFVFAPLQGETAKRLVPEFTDKLDTLVLVEDYETEPKRSIMSHAAFRILWILGGPWRLIGWKYILPSWSTDWAYRLIARNRHRLFDKESCRVIMRNSGRFLD